MEPKSSPESFPQMPSPVELPPVRSPEQAPAATPERAEPSPERTQERSAQVAPSVSVPLPTPVVLPATSSQTTNDASIPDDDNPVAAADEDLIEKEWIDKAKKIIAQTRDDPHRREREVGRLQADYLKKRYDKDLGNS